MWLLFKLFIITMFGRFPKSVDVACLIIMVEPYLDKKHLNEIADYLRVCSENKPHPRN